jgi:hypothetical protein
VHVEPIKIPTKREDRTATRTRTEPIAIQGSVTPHAIPRRDSDDKALHIGR